MPNLPTRTVASAAPLLEFLFAAWPETKKKQVRGWLKTGAVAVNGRSTTQFDHALHPGDAVSIQSGGFAAPQTSLTHGLRIRHEDEDILVIEKPAGLLSIATPSEPRKTAYALLTEHVRRGNRQSRTRVWIVHRLDRETSGLMVFAKSEAAKRALQENWDEAEKKYLAVVEGAPPAAAGLLESQLDESDDFKVRVVEKGPSARLARTRYRVMKKGAITSLLALTLETGRRHQIRVQLAEIGCPIVGDGRYGAKTNPARRVALHATKLSFRHPTDGEMMRLESPLPGELGRLV
jgi:23S rRNA pseudouridine1911/1915/1917 synthase